MMRNGLKLFENFSGIFLEARVRVEAKSRFLKKYAIATGKDISKENSFMIRKNNGWKNGVDARAYFEAPLWVVESLRKLGFRVVKRQIDMDKYEGGLREYTWKICSIEFFWWLVDYGYTIGKNESISYDLYNLKKYLKENRYSPELFAINKIESENPVYEAKLLAS